MSNKIGKRDIPMDVLRIAAALAVIMIHSSSGYVGTSPVTSVSWAVGNVFDAASRWCVPVFVMLSGAFLLQKDIPVKLLYTKYIKHLAVLLLSWNLIYNVIINVFLRGKIWPSGIADAVSYVFCCDNGFHMWYMYMLIGVYVAIPFLKKIVDGGLSRYLLCLWLFLVVALAGESKVSFFTEHGYSLLREYVVVFPFSVEYIGYFVLGHYLYCEVDLSRKMRRLTYSLGFISVVGIATGTYILSVREGTLHQYFYGYHNILVAFVAVAVFVMFRFTPPSVSVACKMMRGS